MYRLKLKLKSCVGRDRAPCTANAAEVSLSGTWEGTRLIVTVNWSGWSNGLATPMRRWKTSSVKAPQNIRSAKSIASPPRILTASLQVMYWNPFYSRRLFKGLHSFASIKIDFLKYVKDHLRNLMCKTLWTFKTLHVFKQQNCHYAISLK